jgi:branched-chain amino acid transport system permease protein
MSVDLTPTFAVSLDFMTAWGFWLGVGVIAGIYGIFALGLQLNIGYTGVINFGQAGFMAIGAYSMVILVTELALSFWLALPLSLLLTMTAGLLVGLPSLRLRADYFAIATIAFAELIRYVAQNARGLTGGHQGTLALELEHERSYSEEWLNVSDWISETLLEPIGVGGTDFYLLPLFLVVWLVLGVLAFGLSRLVASPWGRVLRAIREDEEAAQSVGKNTFAFKLQSLALAAGFGAISGWFLALNLSSFSHTSFLPEITFFGIAILVLGGMTSFAGVLIGSVVFWTVLEGLRFLDIGLAADDIAAIRFMLVGLVLIALMAVRPQGVLGRREEMVLSD